MITVPEDAEDFVDFRITWEERTTCAQFGEDASHTPHVHRR